MSRKTVACEPASKQNSTEQMMEVVQPEVKKVDVAPVVTENVTEVVTTKMETIPEDEIEEEKEEKKEELPMSPKDIAVIKEELEKDVIQIEATMQKVAISELTIHVPESEEVPMEAPAARVPEFNGQTTSSSHAIKKFNKKHRRN